MCSPLATTHKATMFGWDSIVFGVTILLLMLSFYLLLFLVCHVYLYI